MSTMTGDEDPLVSVVVPTYGRDSYLVDAVESVTNQTYNNVELIVVDDCSPVPVEETLDQVSFSDVTSTEVVRHSENRGANAARNTGIENARGEFIAFLDDDDKWAETKIERQIQAFREANDRVGVVYTGQRHVNDRGETTVVRVSDVEGSVTKDIFAGEPLSPLSSMMVRSDAVEQAGLLDNQFPSWQDREWYLRLSLHCEFAAIPEPLVVRRIGSHNAIGDDYEKKKRVSYPLFLEKHRPVAAQHGERYKRKLVASLSRVLGMSALRGGKYHDARKYLFRAIRYDPAAKQSYAYFLVALGGERGYELGQSVYRLYHRWASRMRN